MKYINYYYYFVISCVYPYRISLSNDTMTPNVSI